MNVLDLFSGIGGFSLGLERAGMRTVAFVEIDPFCQQILKKRWPSIPIWGDIREVNGQEIIQKCGTIDIITGGFPCQPFSVAGKRGGKKDDRYLWPEMFRLVKEIKPRWVLGENVIGIVNMALDEVLSDLESEGYETQSFIIPACAVNAPHSRDRVWIIAHSKCLGREERPRQEIRSQEQITERQNFGDVDPKGADCSSSYANSEYCQEYESRNQLCQERRETSFGRDIYEPHWEESWIEIATRLCRVDDGVSSGVDRSKRLMALGNAVVPQIVEVIGKAIMEVEKISDWR